MKLREDIRTPKCPRDGQAFVDFEACLVWPLRVLDVDACLAPRVHVLAV